MGSGRHRRLCSATPEYELDAFEFFSIIPETSSKRQVYKRRDLPFTHLIMITLLFATSLLVPNCRGCLALLWRCWTAIGQRMWSCDRPAAGFAGFGTWRWWSGTSTCTCVMARRSSSVPMTIGILGTGTFFSSGTTATPCSREGLQHDYVSHALPGRQWCQYVLPLLPLHFALSDIDC